MKNLGETSKLACPSCGFLTLKGPSYGSFDICPACEWEDDNMQLSNPDCEGGANKLSLIASQEKAMVLFPSVELEFKGINRDPLWRPISSIEKERFAAEKKEKYWKNSGIVEPKFTYWNSERNLFTDVGNILAKWNPIGVPEHIAYDEYHSYVACVIKSAENRERLRAHLIWIVTDQIGLTINMENPEHSEEINNVSQAILERVGKLLP